MGIVTEGLKHPIIHLVVEGGWPLARHNQLFAGTTLVSIVCLPEHIDLGRSDRSGKSLLDVSFISYLTLHLRGV